eukprot:gb/GECG01012971.1/.p1 GENE.gb/GECG01012971.1/~~gb/GECG01012971.1/.p1  ORF type:complete len:280 (+),score=46.04 gb/GECG01012971.1/:1-840(+)
MASRKQPPQHRPCSPENEDDSVVEEDASSAASLSLPPPSGQHHNHTKRLEEVDTSKLMGTRQQEDFDGGSCSSASPSRTAAHHHHRRIPHVAPRQRHEKRPHAGAYGVTVAKDGSYFKPEKAYKNLDFLNSREAKPIRIMCEYVETERRLKAHGIRNTILFFGSARARPHEKHAKIAEEAKQAIAEASTEDEKAHAKQQLEKLERTEWMCAYYEKIKELSKRLTAWSMERTPSDENPRYIISTGGGPGMMEAANSGAASVPGAKTIGVRAGVPESAASL